MPLGHGRFSNRPCNLVAGSPQAALCHQRRIEVSHRPRRGVARVLEERLPLLLALDVHPLEGRARQVNLAADFDPPGDRLLQAQRNGADRPDVGRDLFAAHAVAARGAAHEAAVLVGERDAEPVDLELGDVVDGGVAQARPLAHALVERAQLVVVVGVVEAEHRPDVLDGRKAVGGRAGDALGRGVGCDEIGVLGLEALELVQQAVERLVGDLGSAVDVVALLVVANLLAELADAVEGIHRRLQWQPRHAARPHGLSRRSQRHEDTKLNGLCAFVSS